MMRFSVEHRETPIKPVQGPTWPKESVVSVWEVSECQGHFSVQLAK